MSKENFIPGIYNYCDRWCERCVLAHRCKLYHNELSQNSSSNPVKENFAEIISRNLEETIELLNKIAQEKGIDLNKIEVNDQAFEKEQIKNEKARQHPLVMEANKYTQETANWVKKDIIFDKENSKLSQQIKLGIQSEKSDKIIKVIQEAFHIINWYSFQIPVKLSSAICYFPHNPDFEDEVQNMHHAAAKISLIGIENSMKAWQSLFENLQEEEDFILSKLLQLQRIQKQILIQFPLIHQFKRPGFDVE